MRPLATGTALLGAALAFSACGRAAGTEDLSIEAVPTLAVREEMRIGNVDDPDLGFSQIGSVDVDRDGRIYVLEWQEMAIRVYEPDGRLVRRIGRRGDGPGEFQSVEFGVVGDTVWVYDGWPKRITLFDRDGTLLSTGRADGARVPLPGGFGFVLPQHMRPDGLFTGEFRLVTYSRSSNTSTGVEEGDPIPVPRVLFDATGAVVDTIGWDASPPPRMVPPPGYQGSEYKSITFHDRRLRVPDPPITLAQWLPLDDGRVILDEAYASGSAEGHFTVTRLGLSGDTVYHRSYPYRPEPYTDEILDSVAVRAARRGSGVVINGVPEPSPDDAEGALPLIRAEMDFPDVQLPVEYAWLANDESVWLRLRNELGSTVHWVVLDQQGLPRGAVELPRNTRPLWSSGDVFWASVYDELEVPWLVRYRLGDD